MNPLLEHFRISALPACAERFRDEVRRHLEATLPAWSSAERSRSWMGFDAAFSRSLAARGWVGLTLPREYGGAGLDAFHRFVLVEELLAKGAPVAAHWIADRQSGPLILRYGNAAQRARYLPEICAANAFFCIGMSEPNAGSDLAGIATRATRTDKGWRLNGSKIWTTHAHHCHYMIALARTAGTAADRQAGLSQFIVDLALPGISVRPIVDLADDAHFSEVHFDDVALADDALIGTEGQGWEQVNAELAFERSGPERIYSSIVLLDHWISGLRAAGAEEAGYAAIGRLVTHLATLREMSIAVTHAVAEGRNPMVPAAVVKDLGTEFEQSIAELVEDDLAARLLDSPGDLDDELVRAAAYVEQISPSYSLRGGTREILRGMIARGLGLR